MRIFAILIIVAAFWLGMVEGDCTPAVWALVVLGQGIFG